MTYDGKNRKIKAEETRRKIYECAEKLFSNHDYNEVSVDSIVKMAGVAKGSFYVHFASKDALVTAMIGDYVKKVDTDYKKFLDSISEDVPVEIVIFSLIDEIVDVIKEKIGRDKMRAIYKAQMTKDIDTKATTTYDRDIYQIFADVLERGIKQGELKTDMSLDILTKHCMMAIRGVTYEWCIGFPEFDYKKQALQHFKIMLDGLRKSPNSLEKIEIVNKKIEIE